MLFFQNYCAFYFLFPLISVFVASFHASACCSSCNMFTRLANFDGSPAF